MTALRTTALALMLLAVSMVGVGRAADVVLKRFEAGSGAEAVGIAIGEGADDREEDAPQALASDPGGKLFLLDQVNHRIVTFDPRNADAPPQTLELPADVQPTDLVVKDDAIYIWDGRVRALTPLGSPQASTRGLAETRAGPVDDATSTAFAQMGSDPAADDDAAGDPTRGSTAKKTPGLSRQAVDTRGRGPVVVDVAIVDRGTGAQLSVATPDKVPVAPKLSLHVSGRLGTVAFLNIDAAGRMFVFGENVPENMRDAAFAFVARYSPKGVLEGVYDLPLTETVSVTRRSVTVSPDGDVYFLKTARKGVEVMGLGFRATPNARMIALARPQTNAASAAWNDAQWVGLAVQPLSRQRILQTAFGYEGLQWTVGPTNYGPDQDQSCSGFAGRIRRPAYLIGKASQPVRGVPYCWGCQGSLPQFVSNIKRGALAGNVCTRDGVRQDVVGVDCSSFVSAAWGLSTHFSTAAIPAISQRLASPWDLQPGDALDKPGSHVVLFLGFTADRQARVVEASPGACQGRVCRNTYPLSSLLARGFIPVRYRALADEPAKNAAQAGPASVAQ